MMHPGGLPPPQPGQYVDDFYGPGPPPPMMHSHPHMMHGPPPPHHHPHMGNILGPGGPPPHPRGMMMMHGPPPPQMMPRTYPPHTHHINKSSKSEFIIDRYLWFMSQRNTRYRRNCFM